MSVGLVTYDMYEYDTVIDWIQDTYNRQQTVVQYEEERSGRQQEKMCHKIQ